MKVKSNRHFKIIAIHLPVPHLICSKYWAFWICSWLPVMVMMRSLEPGMASSIVMPAPDSCRICRIRDPPFPMMAPASCNKKYNGYKDVTFFPKTHPCKIAPHEVPFFATWSPFFLSCDITMAFTMLHQWFEHMEMKRGRGIHGNVTIKRSFNLAIVVTFIKFMSMYCIYIPYFCAYRDMYLYQHFWCSRGCPIFF